MIDLEVVLLSPHLLLCVCMLPYLRCNSVSCDTLQISSNIKLCFSFRNKLVLSLANFKIWP